MFWTFALVLYLFSLLLKNGSNARTINTSPPKAIATAIMLMFPSVVPKTSGEGDGSLNGPGVVIVSPGKFIGEGVERILLGVVDLGEGLMLGVGVGVGLGLRVGLGDGEGEGLGLGVGSTFLAELAVPLVADSKKPKLPSLSGYLPIVRLSGGTELYSY
jgi:hypothetical protein